MEPDDMGAKFFGIADHLVSDEANDYLDERLASVDEWVAYRVSQGQPADLRTLINQVMRENNRRGPVIVAMCAAMWRLREMREANADQ